MATERKTKLQIPAIGVLAVKNLLITKEELKNALSQCAGQKNLGASLKEYFIAKELISTQNMERLARAAKALDLRQKEYKFGAIAIRKGFINQSVLKLALEEQEKQMKEKKKLRLVGDLLVEAGLLSEAQKNSILKLQKRFRKATRELSENGSATGEETGGTVAGQDNGDAIKAGDSPDDSADGETEDDASGLMEPEIINGGLKLEISKDFMAAFLTKTDYFEQDITVEKVHDALLEKGITYGIVTDEMIEGFVKSSGFKTKSFRVAKGLAPIQGKNAKVEFFFNTDYLKAGDMGEDGIIDFKDRGEIPHVEEDTVLAEKTPMVEARTGQNIYGEIIDAIPGMDVALKIGKGAKVSEDGQKVLAAVKGFPKYSLSGFIFVHQEYTTEGDVDYETGHINYDGNVNIKGRIKAGFKVEGNDISALEIDGGVITAEGDVTIAGGINEGTIYARGNVFAKFIHNSEITCMGNLVVEKEIVDSSADCSGSCVVKNGKLISSQVTAKMGVEAKNIGTEMAAPNLVTVGQDSFTEKELEKNKKRTDGIRQQIDGLEEKKKQLADEHAELQRQITELAHIQDRSQLEEKELNSKIAETEQDAGSIEMINELKEKIETLQENAKKAELSLDECFDKSEAVETAMEKHDKEIAAFKQKRDNVLEERGNLIQWAKDNPGKSVVMVEGALMPETIIKGKHSEKRISEQLRRVRVSEILSTSEEGQGMNIYEIQVTNL